MQDNQIKYSLNKATAAEIETHLMQCSSRFIPPLHETVDIPEYSQKIFQNSVTFENWNSSILTGLVAIYLNDPNGNTGFITNVSALREVSGKGIALELMQRCIRHTRNLNFREIVLEVSRENTRVIRFYEFFKFTITGEKPGLFTMRLALRTEGKC